MPPPVPTQAIWSSVASKQVGEQCALPLGDQNRVLLNNGTFVTETTDFIIPGREIDFRWQRTFRGGGGGIGGGWVFSYDQYLLRFVPPGPGGVTQERVLVSDGTGRTFVFKRKGPDYTVQKYEGPGNLEVKLTVSGSGANLFYVVTLKSGEKRFFSVNGSGVGRLQKIEDPSGNSLQFTYSSNQLSKITDTLNREIKFFYYPTGRLKQITDVTTGRSWWYGYGANNDLETVITPSADGAPGDYGYITHYTYDNQHRLISAVYPEGERFHNQYDPVLWQGNPVGTRLTHTRGPGSWVIEKTTIGGPGGLYGGPYPTKIITEVTDRNGNQTHYEIGWPSETFLKKQEKIVRNINPDFQIPQDGVITEFSYEESDTPSWIIIGTPKPVPPDILTTVRPDGGAQIQKIDADGNIVEDRWTPIPSIPPGIDKVRRFEYEPKFGRLVLEADPRAFPDGVVPLDSKFHLVSTPEILKYSTTHEIDDKGKVTKTTFPTVNTFAAPFQSEPPQPAILNFGYNSAGQKIWEIDEKGITTRYYYWPASDPGGKNSPDSAASPQPGGYLAKTVQDSDPSSDGKPPLALTTITRYDARGNVTDIMDPKGNITLRSYDNLNRLRSEIHKVTPSEGTAQIDYETRRNYDGNGNITLLSVHNLRGDGSESPSNPWIDTYNLYNEQNLLIASAKEVQEGVTLATLFFYDKNENRVLVMSPNATTTSSLYYDPKNVVSYVFDDRDLLYSETRGGVADEFATLSAYNHIDLSELGLPQPGSGAYPESTSRKFTYSLSRQLIKTKDSLNKTTQNILDEHGRPHFITDGEGNKRELLYDLLDHVVDESQKGSADDLLSRTVRTYDERSRLIQIEEDFFDHMESPIGDGKNTRSFLYDARGSQIKSRDDRGLVTLHEYDHLARRIKTTDPKGNLAEFILDKNGNPETVKRTELQGTATKIFSSINQFDEMGRLVKTLDPLSNPTIYQFDSRSNLVKATDALGFSSGCTYDGLGRVTIEFQDVAQNGCKNNIPGGCIGTLRFYDQNGNLRQVWDGQGHKTFFDQNSRNEQKAEKLKPETTNPDTYNITFYSNGLIDEMTDANGTKIKHSYDNANRLTKRKVTLGPDADNQGVSGQVSEVNFTWDGSNRLKTAWTSAWLGYGSSVSFEYDSAGRVIKETQNIAFAAYEINKSYDANGNLLSITYPSTSPASYPLTVNCLPDPGLDEIGDIYVNAVKYFHFDYVGPDRVWKRYTTPLPGVSWKLTREYDGDRRPTGHRHEMISPVASTLAAFSYGYNQADQRTYSLREHEGKGDQVEYDGAREVKTVKRDVPASQILDSTTGSYASLLEYIYDLAFNRSLFMENGSPTNYILNPSDNQYDAAGSSALIYNKNGSLIDDGKFRYVYDYGNHLVQVKDKTSGATVVRYAYDALGRRIRKLTDAILPQQVEIWSEDRLLVQKTSNVDGTTTVRQLVYGEGIDNALLLRINGVDYFPLDDVQGSVTHLVNANGVTKESYKYDPFGKIQIFDHSSGAPVNVAASPLGNPSLYTGRSWESECGLYYYRARYYSPSLGRFISRDPVELQGGINRYAYTSNNPVNQSDPSGLYTPGIHYDMTLSAMLNAKNSDGSYKYTYDQAKQAAQAAKDWDDDDKNPGSQDEENAWMHGMTAEGTLPAESFQTMWSHVEDLVAAGDPDSLGGALHMVEDIFAGGHQLQSYGGFGELVFFEVLKSISFGIGTDTHWYADKYPEQINRDLSRMAASLLLDGKLAQTKALIVISLSVGVANIESVEKLENGDVRLTLVGGTTIDIHQDGSFTVKTPNGWTYNFDKDGKLISAYPLGGCAFPVNDWPNAVDDDGPGINNRPGATKPAFYKK